MHLFKTEKLAKLFVFLFCFSTYSAHAFTTKFVRWTADEDTNSDINHVLQKISEEAGFPLAKESFVQQESRSLATSHYVRLAQVYNGLPVHPLTIRLWTNGDTGALIQAEALVGDLRELAQDVRRAGLGNVKNLSDRMSFQEAVAIARTHIRTTEDTQVGRISTSEFWVDSNPVREVKVKARRGEHIIQISLSTRQIISSRYEEYPQHGGAFKNQEDYITLQSKVFPVYEQPEGSTQILDRVPAELRYIKKYVLRASSDPYEALRDRRYYEADYNPLLGNTPQGIAAGMWNMGYIRSRVQELARSLPLSLNKFENGGLILEGKYATINLHAAAVQRFSGLAFRPEYSAQFRPDWRETELNGEFVYEMVPSASFRGKPLMSAEEALTRPATRHPEHDPVTYINDGFDELQVYYAVNAMFESLKPMGFTDPDLSTRPFHAFLFDPDISMRDNAYYTDDTINFTTYSAEGQNMARDNPTIWHELGHGVMDRMMGEMLHLADTGGLSEGMADFVAYLVVQSVTNGESFVGEQDFRIINKTGFYLTNEVHDDGEAYGGTMRDILMAAIARDGREGLRKVTDVVLEAMRLTRDHPALTANVWFTHLLFADHLGREGVRAPDELKELILTSLAGRNFPMDDAPIASFDLFNVTTNEEVTSESQGSRNTPILRVLANGETAQYDLQAKLTESDSYHFKFPVKVKVSLNGGPIQGAIHWIGEDQYPKEYVLNNIEDVANIKLGGTAQCDYTNRDDGACVDFAYIQVLNDGETKPVAKKRFYLRIKNNQQ